jgi:hypothetical protein
MSSDFKGNSQSPFIHVDLIDAEERNQLKKRGLWREGEVYQVDRAEPTEEHNRKKRRMKERNRAMRLKRGVNSSKPAHTAQNEEIIFSPQERARVAHLLKMEGF